MESLPLIRSVGEEAFLSCASPAEDVTTARWERLDGEMPKEATTNRGVLKLPSISRDDEGKYQCTVTRDGLDMVTLVELQVDDFVPVFRGQEALTLPPLSDEKMKHFDMVLTINTTGESGVIFETVRRPPAEGQDPRRIPSPTIEHRARIDDGLVVYEYDIGHGKESIASTNSIVPNKWNTIILKNDDHKAVLQLNSGPTAEKPHEEIVWNEGVNEPLIFGAQIDPRNRDAIQQGFKGVISSANISGEEIPLGKAVRPEHMESYDSCAHKKCLHSSRCRNSNTPKGYECTCPMEYTGEHCQIRSSKCKGEDCNSGICLERDDTWQCVCPLGTGGLRCELEEKIAVDTLGFQQDTSFVSVPHPKSLDQLEISMNVKPHDTQREHILLYIADDYDPESRKHLSVSVVDGAIVYSYSDGEDQRYIPPSKRLALITKAKQKEVIKSSPITADTQYAVVLIRNETATSLIVNGEMFTAERKLKSFEPGTDLFIGGLPPGVDVPTDVPANSFQGCIDVIRVNGKQLDFENPSNFSSGDVSKCPVEFDETTLEPDEVEEETLSTVEVSTTEESLYVYDIKKDDDEPKPFMPPLTGILETTTEPTAASPSFESTSTVSPEVSDEDVFDVTPTAVAVVLSTDEPCARGGGSEDCIANTCVDHECGPNGECIPYNSTYYECKCNLYYDGPRCDLFKPIERAASFNGDAFLEISSDEFPHLTSEKEEIVEFKFKTNESNGVLFWQGQQRGVSVVGEDYFSVGIIDGYIHFSYELGGGAAHMISEQRVDDDKEHVIRLIRKGRRGILKLDDSPEQRSLSSGILAMLNADGNIFIGGVPDIHRATGGIHANNFVGCIADVSLNGVPLDLMGTAIDGKNVKPCDEWILPRRWFKSRRRHRSWTIL